VGDPHVFFIEVASTEGRRDVSKELVSALIQLGAERGIDRAAVLLAAEESYAVALNRRHASSDIHVRLDPESGAMRVFRARRVVEEVLVPGAEWTPEEAQATKPGAVAGDLIELEEMDGDMGRIVAAQARQALQQRLIQIQRDLIMQSFAERAGEILTGVVMRVDRRNLVLDVGKAEAYLPATEQSQLDTFRIGENVKALLLEVRTTVRGPEILLTRTHKNFVKKLFELEVPELTAGTVEITSIAREPGSRTKIVVATKQVGLDPVGAVVGQRGARVQAVVEDLGGEKIDIIAYTDDAAEAIGRALSPAPVVSVTVDEAAKSATVVVPERALSLAIGAGGQNARLAARLTGFRIDIASDGTGAAEAPADAPAGEEA
jgi:transcription termination/antitermination protein NusA